MQNTSQLSKVETGLTSQVRLIKLPVEELSTFEEILSCVTPNQNKEKCMKWYINTEAVNIGKEY